MRKIVLMVTVVAVFTSCAFVCGCGSATDETTSASETTTAPSTSIVAQIDEALIGVWRPLDAGSQTALEFTADGRMLLLSDDPSGEPVETRYRVEDGRIVLINAQGVDEVRAPYTIVDGILSITDVDSGIVETYQR